MKDSFSKYMLKNGVYPIGTITLIWFICSIFDKGYWIYGLWLVFIWGIMTIFNYTLWKTGIPDLFAAFKKISLKQVIIELFNKLKSIIKK